MSDLCDDCKYAAYEKETNANICRAKKCVKDTGYAKSTTED